jgi:hypothetical protein
MDKGDKLYSPYTRKVGTGFRISVWIKEINYTRIFGFSGNTGIYSRPPLLKNPVLATVGYGCRF